MMTWITDGRTAALFGDANVNFSSAPILAFDWLSRPQPPLAIMGTARGRTPRQRWRPGMLPVPARAFASGCAGCANAASSGQPLRRHPRAGDRGSGIGDRGGAGRVPVPRWVSRYTRWLRRFSGARRCALAAVALRHHQLPRGDVNSTFVPTQTPSWRSPGVSCWPAGQGAQVIERHTRGEGGPWQSAVGVPESRTGC